MFLANLAILGSALIYKVSFVAGIVFLVAALLGRTRGSAPFCFALTSYAMMIGVAKAVMGKAPAAHKLEY